MRERSFGEEDIKRVFLGLPDFREAHSRIILLLFSRCFFTINDPAHEGKRELMTPVSSPVIENVALL